MSNADYLKRLADPFKPDEIEWRIQSSGTGNNGIWARAVAYITSRAVMDRLDEVVGPGGWKTEYKEIVTGGKEGQMCTLSIKVGDEWISKSDGADNTAIEPIKGGISGALKRVAVQWGIGRYLYGVDIGMVKTSTERKEGWNWAQTKDKKNFYWQPPQLPAWALPKCANENPPAQVNEDRKVSLGNVPQQRQPPPKQVDASKADTAKAQKYATDYVRDMNWLEDQENPVTIEWMEVLRDMQAEFGQEGNGIHSWPDFAKRAAFYIRGHWTLSRARMVEPDQVAISAMLEEVKKDNLMTDPIKKPILDRLQKALDACEIPW